MAKTKNTYTKPQKVSTKKAATKTTAAKKKAATKKASTTHNSSLKTHHSSHTTHKRHGELAEPSSLITHNSLTIDQKKEWAFTLYVKERLTQKEIAVKTGVTEATISKWVNTLNWDKHRKSLVTTKNEILHFLYDVLNKIKDEMTSSDSTGDAKDADKFVKYTSAINYLETDTSIASIVEVSREITSWIESLNPTDALKFGNYIDGFIKEKLKRF